MVQSGIDDQARSEGIWRHCDIDRSNMIDFKEFLYMLYLWQYAMDVSGTNSSQSNAPTGGYGQDYIKAKKTQLYGAFFKRSGFLQPCEFSTFRLPARHECIANVASPNRTIPTRQCVRCRLEQKLQPMSLRDEPFRV